MSNTFDAMLDVLTNTNIQDQTHLNDDGLPGPIEPIQVHIMDNVTSEDESDRWMTTFMKHGADLLGDAITVAKETRHPRAIEVAHRLLTDLFRSASDLKKLRKEDKRENGVDETDKLSNKIEITPSQLLEMLKSQKEQTND